MPTDGVDSAESTPFLFSQTNAIKIKKTIERNRIIRQNRFMIDPKVLKGFRDFLPENEISRQQLLTQLKAVFENYGFLPIDTPVLEYSEVLLGKGSGETDKQLYRFSDNGNRDVALRFDLTVPFARFMAMNHHLLPLPFKRYHMAKVFRGENTQKGRYREFMQCDFDIVGVDSVEADFEILSLMSSSFKALKIEGITFHLSHRGLFNDFLKQNAIDADLIDILRTVDKLAKIGQQKVEEELAAWCNPKQIEAIMKFISIKAPFSAAIDEAEKLVGSQSEGIIRLKELSTLLKACKMENEFILNLSITRGLDYYTGIVYETFIDQLPTIGSICSGGRYNNLASLYTKEQLPGVGASIGLDRLLAALEELQKIEKRSGLTDLIVFNLDKELKGFYCEITHSLRQQGLKTELYLQEKKIQQQYKYSEKKEIPFALSINMEEKNKNEFPLKDLQSRETVICKSLEEVVLTCKAILSKKTTSF